MKQPRTLRRGDGFVEERTRANGTIRYVARWFDGKQWRGKTFPTYDDAEDHVRAVGRAKRAGRFVPDDDFTVTDMLADYLRRGEDRWTSNTLGLYRSSVDNIIVPRIGRWKVRDITPRRVQTFLDALMDQFGLPTVTRVRTILSGAFREAERLDVVTRSPMPHVRLPQPKPKPPTVWTRAEASRVLASVADDPMLSAWYRLALTSGMRPGELRAVRWQDLDLDTGHVHVRRTATRDAEKMPIISETTKTGKDRTIKIPASTVRALQRWRPRQAEMQLRAKFWKETDLVFPRFDGNVASQTGWDRRHRKVCEDAGVPYLRPHGLRHTYATLSIEAGVDPKVVSTALGHHSAAFTLDVYVTATDAMQQAAAETLGALLDPDAGAV